MPAEYAERGLVPVRTICWSDLWTMPKTGGNFWNPSFDRFDAMVLAFEGSEAAKTAAGSSAGEVAADVAAKMRRSVGSFRSRVSAELSRHRS